MSLEEFATVENEAFTAIFSLVHSSDLSSRLAGIAGLVCLIGVASSDEERKGIKFANNLSNGLRSNSDYEFLAAAAKAMGRMSRGAANADYVEFEVTRALEWLGTERSDRRLAACLVLKELARNAPTIFFSKTNQSAGGPNEFIDKIFPVLRDSKQIVRVCAGEALLECLKILANRQARFNTGEGLQTMGATFLSLPPRNIILTPLLNPIPPHTPQINSARYTLTCRTTSSAAARTQPTGASLCSSPCLNILGTSCCRGSRRFATA